MSLTISKQPHWTVPDVRDSEISRGYWKLFSGRCQLSESPRNQKATSLTQSSHLTTANCYFMTRSSLLLMQRCYSSAFACFLGTTSDTLIHPSALAQPIWAGLLRWYLPFVVLFFLSYISLLMMSYHLIWYTVGCIDDRYIFRSNACHLSRATMAIVYAMHSLLDAPLPVGMMHAYMTTLEVAMNKLVVDLSSQFLETHDTKPVSVPSAM